MLCMYVYVCALETWLPEHTAAALLSDPLHARVQFMVLLFLWAQRSRTGNPPADCIAGGHWRERGRGRRRESGRGSGRGW